MKTLLSIILAVCALPAFAQIHTGGLTADPGSVIDFRSAASLLGFPSGGAGGGNITYASQISGVVLDCNVVNGLKLGVAASSTYLPPVNNPYRGAWAGGTAYVLNDVALSSGANWVAVAASTGVTPGTDATKWVQSCDSATDNTTRINAVLATATEANPVNLVLDGGTSTTGLHVPAGGHYSIRGIGKDSGLWMRSGSNSYAIFSQNQNALGSTPDPRGANIIIRDFTINGHRNGPSNRSASPNFPFTVSTGTTDAGGGGGAFLIGIFILSANNIEISGMNLYDMGCYATLLVNVGNVHIDRNVVNAPSMAVNTDGLHISGPADKVWLTDNDVTEGDDCIALNSPEIIGGSITNVFIKGLNCRGGNVLRLYANSSATSFITDNIFMSDSTGVGQYGNIFIIGDNPTTNGSNNFLHVSNSRFQILSGGSSIAIGENVGRLELSGVTFSGSNNPLITSSAGTVSSLVVDRVTPSGSTTSYGSGVTAISGPGVANIGFNIPDAVTADGTTYLSTGGGACAAGALCWRSGSTSQQILAAATVAGPVQKWLMNEGASPFLDSSGHTNNLTFGGTFTTVAGIPGTAPTFNGTNSGAVAANNTNTNFDGSTPFSTSIWAKATTSASAGVLFRAINTTPDAAGWQVEENSNNSVAFTIISDLRTPNFLSLQTSANTITETNLNHIVMTYDGSKTTAGVKMYFNGTLFSMPDINSNTLTGSTVSTQNVNIGQTSSGNAEKFIGVLADARIWNRVLSASEVTALFAAGAQ